MLQNHARQQPVLVGTRSIEISERLSQRLMAERLQVLALILVLRDKLDNTKGLDKEKEQEYHALLNTKLDDLYMPKLGAGGEGAGRELDPLAPANLAALAQVARPRGRRRRPRRRRWRTASRTPS